MVQPLGFIEVREPVARLRIPVVGRLTEPEMERECDNANHLYAKTENEMKDMRLRISNQWRLYA